MLKFWLSFKASFLNGFDESSFFRSFNIHTETERSLLDLHDFQVSISWKDRDQSILIKQRTNGFVLPLFTFHGSCMPRRTSPKRIHQSPSPLLPSKPFADHVSRLTALVGFF